MAAKLKSLKVAELKAILSRANVSFPTKATKSDLIAKINATPAALLLVDPPTQTDDLLAPPEEVDWNSDVAVVTTPDPKPPKNTPASVSKPVAPIPTTKDDADDVNKKPPPVPVTENGTPKPLAQEDEELEKRKARAARFGVPLVHPKPARVRGNNSVQKPNPVAIKTDDPEKLIARAERFGTMPVAGHKRNASAENVDNEELQRRKKRAERFGIQAK